MQQVRTNSEQERALGRVLRESRVRTVLSAVL